MGKNISINIKLFSGIDKETGIENYDYVKGLDLQVEEGIRLGKVLKKIGLKKKSYHTLFLNGDRITTWQRLNDGDEIACLKPAGGG